jgi:hypothetical protein
MCGNQQLLSKPVCVTIVRHATASTALNLLLLRTSTTDNALAVEPALQCYTMLQVLSNLSVTADAC